MMKGYKMLTFGLLTAVLPAVLTFLGGIDWTTIGISPGMGAMLGAAIVALRVATTTPIGQK